MRLFRRRFPFFAVIALFAALLIGCGGQQPDEATSQQATSDTSATGPVTVPAARTGGAATRDTAGWQIRPDQADARRSDVTFEPGGDTLRVTSGPAAIYYHNEDTASVPFSASAQFTQLERTEHPESYGIFFGGKALQSSNQRYTYFLVRQDGQYLIKRRAGTRTSIIQGWTAHDAVRAMDGNQPLTNELAVSISRDSLRFMINDEQVASRPSAQRISENGQVGLRINHQLDLRVNGFQVSSGT